MKDLSTIKEIESDGIKSELALDLFMRLEHGLDGNWAIVWSEVNEVGPKPINLLKPTRHNDIPSSPFISAKPKLVWRPRQTPTMLNLAHCQSSKSDLAAHVLGSQLQKPLEIQLPIERQEGASSRGDELRTMTVCGAEATQGFGFQDSGFTEDMVVSLELAGSEPVMINRFYPLLDLGNGLEAEFGEGEAHVEEVVSRGVS